MTNPSWRITKQIKVNFITHKRASNLQEDRRLKTGTTDEIASDFISKSNSMEGVVNTEINCCQEVAVVPNIANTPSHFNDRDFFLPYIALVIPFQIIIRILKHSDSRA